VFPVSLYLWEIQNCTTIVTIWALGQLDHMHGAVQYYNMWPVKVKISCLIHWNHSSLDSHSLLQLCRQMNTIFLCTRTYAPEIWSLRMTKMSKCIKFGMHVSLTQYKWQSTELKCRVCSHKQKFVYPDVLLWENICKVSNFLGCDAVLLGE